MTPTKLLNQAETLKIIHTLLYNNRMCENTRSRVLSSFHLFFDGNTNIRYDTVLELLERCIPKDRMARGFMYDHIKKLWPE
jgi:hypothetical protein